MSLGRRTGRIFAQLDQDLLQHPAVTTLPHASFRVLAILSIGAYSPGLNPRKQPGRNGVQAITDRHARLYGITSRDTVYSALRILQERGLIVRTREGFRDKRHFALYAVTWLPITHRDGQPLDIAEAAPRGYESWTAPICRPVAGDDPENLPSGYRESSRPASGHDQTNCRPIAGQDPSICRPVAGNTLRISQGTPQGLRDQVARAHRELPRLQAGDIARMLQRPDEIEAIRQILQELRHGC